MIQIFRLVLFCFITSLNQIRHKNREYNITINYVEETVVEETVGTILKIPYGINTSATGQASARPTFLSVSYQESAQKCYSS